MTMISPEGIAKICHEANRAYCEVVNSSVRSSPWEDTEEHTKKSVIDGVLSCLDDPTRSGEESHKEWCDFKKADGWVYGEKKDLALKTHPNLVHYESLAPVERYKDDLFIAIVKTFR